MNDKERAMLQQVTLEKIVKELHEVRIELKHLKEVINEWKESQNVKKNVKK